VTLPDAALATELGRNISGMRRRGDLFMENASAPLFMERLTLARCEILVWAGVRDLPGAERTDTLEAPLGKKSLVVIN
jgi:hypothetical protein